MHYGIVSGIPVPQRLAQFIVVCEMGRGRKSPKRTNFLTDLNTAALFGLWYKDLCDKEASMLSRL